MPINEAAFRRGGLTKQQKREAEAAIYGLQETVVPDQLTAEEIERMRALVMQHDSQASGRIKEFDLNNPPVLPYVYREFPLVVYHHPTRRMRAAQNADDLATAIEAGWTKEPFPREEELEGEASEEKPRKRR